MKRSRRILTPLIVALLLAVVALPAAAFAAEKEARTDDSGGGLTLTESYPHMDGSETHMPVQNVGIKLYFSGDVSAEDLQEANAKCFKLTQLAEVVAEDAAEDAEPEIKKSTIPIEVYYSDKKGDSNYILVTANPESGTLLSKTDYELTISGNLESADGSTLGTAQVIKFHTVDVAGNSKVYMLLMVIMVVCMIGFNTLKKKRQANAEAAVKEKEKIIDPYKLAKEKKISVQEAIAIVEKEKKRRAKKLALAENAKKKDGGKKEEEDDNGHKKVKRVRRVSEGGSTYKTGRKAAAEKKAREEAARKQKGTTNPKKGKGKKKKK
jgi:hypothetical protein